MPLPNLHYIKTFSSTAEHITLFRSRGLVIDNEALVEHSLKFIGYYRLSAYTRPFQINEDHQFRKGTTFEQVLDLYIFDRKLRLLLFEAIEQIEIGVRAAINNVMAESLGYPFRRL